MAQRWKPLAVIITMISGGCAVTVQPDDGDAGPYGDASGTESAVAVGRARVFVAQYAPTFVGASSPMGGIQATGIFLIVGSSYRENQIGECIAKHFGATRASPVFAGPVTLTVADASVSVPWDQSQAVYGYEAQTALTPQEPVTFTAEGGVAPHFTSTLAVPPAISLTIPVPDSSGRVAIPLDRDLTLNWSGSPHFVEVTINARSVSGEDTQLVCTYAGSAGVATIPRATLSELTGINIISMTVAAADSQSISINSWRIDVSAESLAADLRPLP